MMLVNVSVQFQSHLHLLKHSKLSFSLNNLSNWVYYGPLKRTYPKIYDIFLKIG